MKIDKLLAKSNIGNYAAKTQTLQQFDSNSRNIKRDFSLNDLPSAQLGKSNLISFGLKSFEEAVKENYFQLPIDPTTGVPYQPNESQLHAARAIHNREDHLLTTPTSNGKTAAAKFAISMNMEEGKRSFYTTPLKALSDEKWREFKKIWGDDNVGLLTGDVKINPKAPILVMTTEIAHNMAFANNFDHKKRNEMDNVGTVILDEMHYMGDNARGHIWTELIELLPKNTQLLELSATVGNHQEIADWQSSIRGKKTSVTYVPQSKRIVPLNYNITDVNSKSPTVSIDTFLKKLSEIRKQSKLPMICFDYSKKHCQQMIDELAKRSISLNSITEQKEVAAIVQKYKDEGKYLGESFTDDSLIRGFGVHNSGILPAQKELAEELCQKGLLKVTMATGTLEAGINMPVKTVLFFSIRKPDVKFADELDDGKRYLTANELFQSAGRAGRLSIDKEGFVDFLSSSKETHSKIEQLLDSKPDDIVNKFSPDLSAIINYYDNSLTDDNIKYLIGNTFSAYDKNPKIKQRNIDYLTKQFNDKKGALKKFGYLTEDNVPTLKGHLISVLNGYEQIPIIEMIHSKKIANLSPEELAGFVGSMAYTSDQTQEDFISKGINPDEFIGKDYEFMQSELSNVMYEFDKFLSKYNNSRMPESEFQDVAQFKAIAPMARDWVAKNAIEEDSILNWKSLCKKYKSTNTDEGTLFKQLTQTSDLLKQVVEVAQKGIELSSSVEDLSYYNKLAEKAKTAIKLIGKKPIL